MSSTKNQESSSDHLSSPQEGESQFSFPEMEKRVLNFWNKNQIFEKSLKQGEDRSHPPYIFYDGPPFATGLPHHGHLVASTLKDIVPRYFTMKGYYVHRRFGWDCHGLPIEQEIDKKFNMSAHEYVKKNGMASYNNECRSIVLRYTSEWEKTIRRLGRWVDFENNYKTMDLPFMESVWWVFKKLWDQELIYRGEKVVPFSTAFGTVLSNFEANLNYQDVQDPAITILFESHETSRECGEGKTYYAAWTTTPWTLPSNLSLCVHPDIIYQKLYDKKHQIYLYMAKDRYINYYAKKLELLPLLEVTGKELEHRSYNPLFPYFSDLSAEGAFKILVDEYVTTTDGTGIVHQAPGFGEDDYRVMKRYGFKHSSVCPVDDYGKFTKEVSDYHGEYVKDADKKIIKSLKDQGLLLEQSTLVHSYPFCYRTDTPLIYRAISSWYVQVEKIKEDLLKVNQEIHWVPEHIKEGRFGKWLEGARDWSISRNRIWGTPIPIWQNDETGKYICLGSIEELKNYSGKSVTDLHREYIDEITFTLPGESGTYRRIQEVLDCWFESGSMPYAQLHYPFENKKLFEETFPAKYIAEGLDQTRGWFYTLTVLSTALFKRPAFTNVIVNGLVLASDGKKMSKRLQNYTQPDILMENFGADALRLFLINSGLVRGEELRFSDEGVKDMVRRALLPWYNSFKFFITYAEVDRFDPSKDLTFGENPLDRWILSRLQNLVKIVNQEMDEYHLYNVVPALFHFIEDLTNWYIRLNRRRFWEDESLTQSKKEAYSTLYKATLELSKLMAPFAPFLADYIYLELQKLDHHGSTHLESVHLESFPTVESIPFKSDLELESAVVSMMEITLLGRQYRNQVQVKVKTPFRSITIIHRNEKILKQIEKHLESYIKGELNIKEIAYSQKEEEFINLYAKPNTPILGKRLGKRLSHFKGLIESLTGEQLERVEQGESITLEEETFTASDFLILREPKGKDNSILSNRFITIKIDGTLNQELLDEGVAREIVNRIQKSRKELLFHVADRIELAVLTSSPCKAIIEKHSEYLKSETLTMKILTFTEEAEFLTFESPAHPLLKFDIDEHQIQLKLKRVNH